MNKAEEMALRRKVVDLETRIAKLEALLKPGLQIGETEHGDLVYATAPRPTGLVSRMAEALLGPKQ